MSYFFFFDDDDVFYFTRSNDDDHCNQHVDDDVVVREIPDQKLYLWRKFLSRVENNLRQRSKSATEKSS